MGAAERVAIDHSMYELAVVEAPGRLDHFASSPRRAELIMGERKLMMWAPAIRELRHRCGQDDDLTTDPQYFVATNTLKHRRVAAVLIHSASGLEACVFFFEHCRLSVGLGIFRGGDGIGESLVAGPYAYRLQYIHLATQVLLRDWRIHGVSLVVLAPIEECMEVMGRRNEHALFAARQIQRKLALAPTYRAMLDGLGRRTRRSLAKKRQQLEKNAGILFEASLSPWQAQTAMLQLKAVSLPQRNTGFYHARCELMGENPDFFCMGICLPNGSWLSVLSGWRRNRITYVDLQMNDMNYKKESLSAVMRSFLLEQEIALGQQLINFVGGTSLLLRRYCQPAEPCTHAFFWRPCLRAMLFKMIVPHLQPKSVYQRVRG